LLPAFMFSIFIPLSFSFSVPILYPTYRLVKGFGDLFSNYFLNLGAEDGRLGAARRD
jgi:hypothetical protein